MQTILMLIYGAACTLVGWCGLRALYRMSPRTPHLRRSAFILLTLGAACAYIEAIRALPPMASALCIAVGACLLLLCGARSGGSRQRVDRAPLPPPTLRDSAFHR
jgi:peptidoglycan/LPS O-acetylase OafA/YrhL